MSFYTELLSSPLSHLSESFKPKPYWSPRGLPMDSLESSGSTIQGLAESSKSIGQALGGSMQFESSGSIGQALGGSMKFESSGSIGQALGGSMQFESSGAGVGSLAESIAGSIVSDPEALLEASLGSLSGSIKFDSSGEGVVGGSNRAGTSRIMEPWEREMRGAGSKSSYAFERGGQIFEGNADIEPDLNFIRDLEAMQIPENDKQIIRNAFERGISEDTMRISAEIFRANNIDTTQAKMLLNRLAVLGGIDPRIATLISNTILNDTVVREAINRGGVVGGLARMYDSALTVLQNGITAAINNPLYTAGIIAGVYALAELNRYFTGSYNPLAMFGYGTVEEAKQAGQPEAAKNIANFNYLKKLVSNSTKNAEKLEKYTTKEEMQDMFKGLSKGNIDNDMFKSLKNHILSRLYDELQNLQEKRPVIFTKQYMASNLKTSISRPVLY